MRVDTLWTSKKIRWLYGNVWKAGGVVRTKNELAMQRTKLRLSSRDLPEFQRLEP